MKRMNKRITRNFILTFLFSISIISAKAQWVECPSGVSTDLNAVHFVDVSVGFAAGINGTLIRTTDGGLTWSNCDGIDDNLYTIYANSLEDIFAGGSTLYHSTQGGTEWTDAGHPYPKSIAFVDENTGYLADIEGLYKTTDGGTTWELGYDATSAATLEDISVAINEDDTLVAAIGNIGGFATYSTIGIRLADDGQWYSLDANCMPNAYAYASSYFIDPDTAYLFTNENQNWMPSDNNQLVKMTNFRLEEDVFGDLLWRFDSEIVNDDMPGFANDCWFSNESNGWIVTEEGGIYQTTDGGQTWNESYLGDEVLRGLDKKGTSESYSLVAVGGNGLVLKQDFGVPTDHPPVIANQVEPVILETYPASEVIDLTGAFTDPDNDDEEIEITIYGVSNTTDIEAELDNNLLTISRLTTVEANGQISIRATSNGLYADMQIEVICLDVTGVSQNFNSIKIGPNPCSQNIRISGEIEGNTSYKLMNMHGQIIQSGRLQNNLIDVQLIAEGNYFLLLESSSSTKAFKVIKK